jgi:hypothetical protein
MGGIMQPMRILQCVRKGYAIASTERVALVRGCVDLEVLNEHWVPRWALDAASSLEHVGYGPQQIAGLFTQGKTRVLAELTALAQAGKLARAVEPRHTYERSAIDEPTHQALNDALFEHRQGCAVCKAQRQCMDADLLEEEMQLLFPPDRRKQPRS